MHELGKALFRHVTGTDIGELARVPTGQQILKTVLKEQGSQYRLRKIGWASDGEVTLSEEERESHIHIIGAPGEGKSKFIEMLVEQDIDEGYGACVLDQSRGGATVYKILNYCIKQGFENVVLIDPHDIFKFGRVPIINPFHYYEGNDGKTKPDEGSVRTIQDTIRVLWGSKPEETAKINKYLPAILHTLHASKMTLREAAYFGNQTHLKYRQAVDWMIENLHPYDDNRIALESLFRGGRFQFAQDMDSTSRRLNPLFERRIQLLIGSNRPSVPFVELIKKKWLILVNLDRTRLWHSEQQRLLGTMVLNELIDAVDRLWTSGWRGRYYVYVDEFGQYATRNMADFIAYQRKSGLSFAFGHQYFGQIEDKYVADAVEHAAKIKVVFNTAGRDDRDRMVRTMYGGDIPDRQVSYELGHLGKQHAAIKINKQPPRITQLNDVPDIEYPTKVVDDFKAKLYEQWWYQDPQEVLNEINARLKKTESEHVRQPTKARTPPDSGYQRNTKRTVEPSSGRKNKRQDSGSVRPPAVPDDSADSPPVLFKKTGRSTSKVPKVQPPES